MVQMASPQTFLLILLIFQTTHRINVDASPLRTGCNLPDKNEPTVDLSSCHLTYIPEILKEFINLNSLYFNNNKLTHFNSSLISFSKIKKLLLRNNNISNISNLKSNYLEVLDLSFNKIKKPIHPLTFEGLTNCKTVYLQGNDDDMCLATQKLARDSKIKCAINCGDPQTSPISISTSLPNVIPETPISLSPTPSTAFPPWPPPSLPPSPPPSLPTSPTPSTPPTPTPKSAPVTTTAPADSSEGTSSSTSQKPESPQTYEPSTSILVAIGVVFVILALVIFLLYVKCKSRFSGQAPNNSTGSTESATSICRENESLTLKMTGKIMHMRKYIFPANDQNNDVSSLRPE